MPHFSVVVQQKGEQPLSYLEDIQIIIQSLNEAFIKEHMESLLARPCLYGCDGADVSGPVLRSHGDRRITCSQ